MCGTVSSDLCKYEEVNLKLRSHKLFPSASITLAMILSLTGCSAATPNAGMSTNEGSSMNASKSVKDTTTNTSQTPDSNATTSDQNSIVPPLASLQMVDSNTGWATGLKGKVWITTDGGKKWNNVTPKAISTSSSTVVRMFGLDAKHSWIAVTSDSLRDNGIHPVAIFHTSDGGKSWSKQKFSGVGVPITLSFSNARDGSIALTQGAAGGSEAETIYQTSDGGTTWTKAGFVNLYGGTLPFAGDKTGASFLDQTHGWATGYPVNGNVFLYRTEDAGQKWKGQTVIIPPNHLHQTNFVTYPPVFFNHQDGVLPTWVDTNPGTFLVFYTSDGGNTWKPTTSITREVQGVESQDWSFPSSTNWFVTDDKQLLVTNNSGQTWSIITPNISFTKVSALDFTSSSDGWILMSSGQTYHTTDGGHTWNKIT